jgi:hypothetical protein
MSQVCCPICSAHASVLGQQELRSGPFVILDIFLAIAINATSALH